MFRSTALLHRRSRWGLVMPFLLSRISVNIFYTRVITAARSIYLDSLPIRHHRHRNYSSKQAAEYAGKNPLEGTGLLSKDEPTSISSSSSSSSYKGSVSKSAWVLNAEQQKAVECLDKYVRVVAGPGSGKTRVLTYRIAFMIKFLDVPPSQILCIAFTNKAANEIRTRLNNFLGSSISQHVMVGTVHSICAQILRNCSEISDHHLTQGYVIYDEDDSRKIVKSILEEVCFGPDLYITDENECFSWNEKLQQGPSVASFNVIPDFYVVRASKLEQIRSHILDFLEKYQSKKLSEEMKISVTATAVNDLHSLLNRARLFNMYDFIAIKNRRFSLRRTFPPNFVFQLAEIYELELRRANAVDFDDLLCLVARIFYKHPKLLKDFRNTWRHILVDEFQDIDGIQYELIRLLAMENEGLFVVGDTDQAIYEWRGAQPMHMQYSLVRDFPDIATFQLTKNYRSTNNILTVASAILKSSPSKPPVDSRATFQGTKMSGAAVFIKNLPTNVEEGNFIASEIRRLVSSNAFTWHSFAILYRTHFQSHFIELSLMRNNVPFVAFGSKPFCVHKEIKYVLSYLHLVANIDNNVALENIINVPNRGIGPRTLARVKQWAYSLNIPILAGFQNICEADVIPKELKLNSSARSALQDFLTLITELKYFCESDTVAEIVRAVIERTQLKPYLEKRYTKDDSYGRRCKRLSVLEAASENYGTGRRELLSFLQGLYFEPPKMQNTMDENGKGCVRLMTLHASKGLEFDCVFICGLEQGVLPLLQQNVHEERRLFYVGVTRAMKRLYLTHASTKLTGKFRKANRSEFIDNVLKVPGTENAIEEI